MLQTRVGELIDTREGKKEERGKWREGAKREPQKLEEERCGGDCYLGRAAIQPTEAMKQGEGGSLEQYHNEIGIEQFFF